MRKRILIIALIIMAVGTVIAAMSQPRATEADERDLLDGLVSYWTLDEASGVRYDAHGGNDLTDNNTVGSITGVISVSATFDWWHNGAEWLSVTDNPTMSVAGDSFSVAGWVYPIGWDCFLYKWGSSAADQEFSLGLNGAGEVRFKAGSASVPCYIDRPYNYPAWNYFVAWYDADAEMIYLQLNNGSIQSTACTEDTDGSAPLIIGRESTSYCGGQPMAGYVDEVGYWHRVLSVAERCALYNGGYGLEYPFDAWEWPGYCDQGTLTPNPTYTPIISPTSTAYPTSTVYPTSTPWGTSTLVPTPGECTPAPPTWTPIAALHKRGAGLAKPLYQATLTGSPPPTYTPLPSQTPYATSTPGPTYTPEGTYTPEATYTPEGTYTPEATYTPRPTCTDFPTFTPAPYSTTIPTLTPTWDPTQPTPTVTPMYPTPTPTPPISPLPLPTLEYAPLANIWLCGDTSFFYGISTTLRDAITTIDLVNAQIDVSLPSSVTISSNPFSMAAGFVLLMAEVPFLQVLFSFITVALAVIIVMQVARFIAAFWGIVKRVIDLLGLLPFI